MALAITIQGIDEALSHFNYRNKPALKYRFIGLIRGHYEGETVVEAVQGIDADELIRILWDTGDDTAAVRNRRKNLKSVKSAINNELKKLYDEGKNPEGITIGPENTFVMSDEARNNALEAFIREPKKDSDALVGQVKDVLKVLNEVLSTSPYFDDTGEKDDPGGLQEIKALIRDLTEKAGLSGAELVRADAGISHTESVGEDQAGKTQGEGGPGSGTDQGGPGGAAGGDPGGAETGDAEAGESESDDSREQAGGEIALDEAEDAGDAEEADEGLEEIEGDEIEEILEEVEEAEDAEGVSEGLEEIEGNSAGEILLKEGDESDSGDSREQAGENLGAGEDVEEIDLNEEVEEIDELLEEAKGDEVEELLEEVDEAEESEDAEEIGEELEEGKGDEIDELLEEIDEAEDVGAAEEIDGELEEIDELLEEVDVAEDAEEAEEVDPDEDLEEVEELLEEVDEAEDAGEGVPDDDLEAVDEVEDVEEVDPDEELEEVDEDEVEDLLEEVEEEEDGDRTGAVERGPYDIHPGEPGSAIDEEHNARLLAEKFNEALAAMDKFYNQYILIPEDTFTIGSGISGKNRNIERMVHLPSFYMGKSPVTNVLFEIFIEETGYKTTAETVGYGTVFNGRHVGKKTAGTDTSTTFSCNSALSVKVVKGACWYQPFGPGSTLYGKRNHPVVQVSLEDAKAFAAWTGKRLPTEEEWEAAARTSSGHSFPWGEEWIDNSCNVEESLIGDTTPVDKYGDFENSYGIADTLGNVLEWTVTLSKEPDRGKGGSGLYITKGGSFISGNGIRLSDRTVLQAQYHSNILGFRCVAY